MTKVFACWTRKSLWFDDLRGSLQNYRLVFSPSSSRGCLTTWKLVERALFSFRPGPFGTTSGWWGNRIDATVNKPGWFLCRICNCDISEPGCCTSKNAGANTSWKVRESPKSPTFVTHSHMTRTLNFLFLHRHAAKLAPTKNVHPNFWCWDSGQKVRFVGTSFC